MRGDTSRLIREAEQRLRRQLRPSVRPQPSLPATTIETQGARSSHAPAYERVDAWFAARGLRPLAFQRETWLRYRARESGLIHASTGTGKTLAAWLGPVMDAIDDNTSTQALQVIFPGRRVSASLLYTAGPRLIELTP